MISEPGSNHTKAEATKLGSDLLRGTIAERLANVEEDAFGEADASTLKFHGVYQQDDRDQRIPRRRAGLGKLYSLMVRVRLPGGRATATQYSVIDDLATRYGGGSLRLTTRQTFQLHGVVKSGLGPAIRAINTVLMTTFAACGDIARNVMAPPVPFSSPAYRDVRALVEQLAAELIPATDAYHEIWVDGQRARTGVSEEPLYGPSYLPRKFKIGVTVAGDNSIDAWTHDVALIGHRREADEGIDRYTVLVGGGLGMTHDKPQTYARLSTPLATIDPGDVSAVVRTLVELFRDAGDRSNRKHARFKYIVEEWGIERVRDELEHRLGRTLRPPETISPMWQHDALGRIAQGDGRESLGIHVPAGRIIDHADGRWYRSAFRAIVHELGADLVLTPMQSITFTGLTPAEADRAEEILREHGVPLVDELTAARRYALACPALPTCGLALADAERVLPRVVADLEHALGTRQLTHVPVALRITGCPNGCARPYNADIGLVGRRPGHYHVFVGGGLAGDRLADLYASDVPLDRIIPELEPLLDRFVRERDEAETLGDFYQRLRGVETPRTRLTGDETPTASLLSLPVLP